MIVSLVLTEVILLQLDGVGIGLEIVPLRLFVRAALGGDDRVRAPS